MGSPDEIDLALRLVLGVECGFSQEELDECLPQISDIELALIKTDHDYLKKLNRILQDIVLNNFNEYMERTNGAASFTVEELRNAFLARGI